MLNAELLRFSYPRVSEILSPFSKFQYKEINEEILKYAAERGTRIHAYCSDFTKGIQLIDIDNKETGYIESFKKWYSYYVGNVLCNEERMYCDEMQFSGQCDFIVRLKKEKNITLVDIKTCAKIEKTHLAQVSAYLYLAYKSGYNVKEAHIVRLKKTGAHPEIRKYSQDELDIGWKLFEAAYKWYRYLIV